MYYITAIVTLISATLGVLFSIVFVRKEKENSRTNALYMFARSLALLIIAVIPLFINSIQILTIVTAAMCVVQIVDGFIGIAIKNRFHIWSIYVGGLSRYMLANNTIFSCQLTMLIING